MYDNRTLTPAPRDEIIPVAKDVAASGGREISTNTPINIDELLGYTSDSFEAKVKFICKDRNFRVIVQALKEIVQKLGETPIDITQSYLHLIRKVLWEILAERGIDIMKLTTLEEIEGVFREEDDDEPYSYDADQKKIDEFKRHLTDLLKDCLRQIAIAKSIYKIKSEMGKYTEAINADLASFGVRERLEINKIPEFERILGWVERDNVFDVLRRSILWELFEWGILRQPFGDEQANTERLNLQRKRKEFFEKVMDLYMFLHQIAASLKLSIDDLETKMADPQKFHEETKKAIDTGDALMATIQRAGIGTKLKIAAGEHPVPNLRMQYLSEATAVRNELGLGRYE